MNSMSESKNKKLHNTYNMSINKDDVNGQNMFKTLIFTRLLYPLDDVVYSFMNSFKSSIYYETLEHYDEIVYWLCELYMSGFTSKTVDVLYDVYYLYAYVSDESGELLTTMNRILLQLKERENTGTDNTCDQDGLYIVLSTLDLLYTFPKKSLYMHTILEQFNEANHILNTNGHNYYPKITLYRGKKPKWVEININPKYHLFARSVQKRNVANIIYHCLRLDMNDNDVFTNMLSCIQHALSCTVINDKDTNELESNESLTFKTNSDNQCSLALQKGLMYFILRKFIIDEHTDINESIIKERKKHDRENIDNHNISYKSIDKDSLLYYTSNYDNVIFPPHKVLRNARHYVTHKMERTSDENIILQDAYYNKWLYFASKSPIWKKRCTKYGGVVNDNTYSVVFDENNDSFEDFHNKYAYDPDEQPEYVDYDLGII